MQKPLSRTERRLLVILNTLLIALPLALLLLLFLALQGRNATHSSSFFTVLRTSSIVSSTESSLKANVPDIYL